MAMRQKTSATGRPRPLSSQNYQYIQPTIEWKQEGGCAVLVVHLPGFSKEQLGVQLLSTDKLRVRGTRQLRANTFIRLDQTYPIPQDCTTSDLQAKFEGGLLSVIFQKKKTAAPATAAAAPAQEKQSIPQPVKEGKDSSTPPPPPPPQTVPATSRTEAKPPPPPPPPPQTVPATSRTEAKPPPPPPPQTVPATSRTEAKPPPPPPPPPSPQTVQVTSRTEAKSPEEDHEDNSLRKPSHGDKTPADTKTATEAPSSKKAGLSSSNEPEVAQKVERGDEDVGKQKHPSPYHVEKPPPNAAEQSKEGETDKESKLADATSNVAKQNEGGDQKKMENESNSSSSMKADQKKRRAGDGNYNIDESGKDDQKGAITTTTTATKNAVADDDDDNRRHRYKYEKYKQIVMDLITPKDDEERKLLVNIGVAALVIVALGTYISYSRWSSGRRQ